MLCQLSLIQLSSLQLYQKYSLYKGVYGFWMLRLNALLKLVCVVSTAFEQQLIIIQVVQQ